METKATLRIAARLIWVAAAVLILAGCLATQRPLPGPVALRVGDSSLIGATFGPSVCRARDQSCWSAYSAERETYDDCVWECGLEPHECSAPHPSEEDQWRCARYWTCVDGCGSAPFPNCPDLMVPAECSECADDPVDLVKSCVLVIGSGSDPAKAVRSITLTVPCDQNWPSMATCGPCRRQTLTEPTIGNMHCRCPDGGAEWTSVCRAPLDLRLDTD
jgi:hypothetical protein